MLCQGLYLAEVAASKNMVLTKKAKRYEICAPRRMTESEIKIFLLQQTCMH